MQTSEWGQPASRLQRQPCGSTVVQNINVTTGIQQTVRNEIRSLMPEIAANAKNAVTDSKRRGGNFGRAFA